MTKARLQRLLTFSFRFLTELLILYVALLIGWMTLFSISEGNDGWFERGVLFLSGFLILRVIIFAIWNASLLIRKRLEQRKSFSMPSFDEYPKSRLMKRVHFLTHLISELAVLVIILILDKVIIFDFNDGFHKPEIILTFCICSILLLRVLYFGYSSWKTGFQM